MIDLNSLGLNRTFTLPSGQRATRHYAGAPPDGIRFALHGAPVVLTVADVEALYAEAIAGDGGRDLPDPRACANRRRYATIANAGNARLARGLRNPRIVGCGECGGYHLEGDRT